MHTILGGKRWKLRDVKSLPKGWLGECRYDTREVMMPLEGDTESEMNVIVHETIHASAPYLEEDAVEALATDIVKILWKLNWRRQYEKEQE